MNLAWGAKVSTKFRTKLITITQSLEIPDPSHLMACMAFETGRTFSPACRNKAGSGAVGLIQFMPQTAAILGTSSDELVNMPAEDQLYFVWKYFSQFHGAYTWNLSNLYMAILWPAAIGKPASYILFNQEDPHHPKYYIQNAGLDWNENGIITKEEACRPIHLIYAEGLLPSNVFILKD